MSMLIWDPVFDTFVDDKFPSNTKHLIELGSSLVVLSVVMRYDYLNAQKKMRLST